LITSNSNQTQTSKISENDKGTESESETEKETEPDASEASEADTEVKTCVAGQIMITRDNDPSDQAKEGVIDSDTTKNLLILDSQGKWGVPECESSKTSLSLSNKIFKMVSKTSFSCIDGRVKEKGLSALGGDAGEFLLALSVFAEYSKKEVEFNEKEVQRLLEIYLNKMRPNRFYMCTDQESLKNIEMAVGSSGFSLKNVKQSLQKNVLEHVIKSANVGSVHIQKMLGKKDNSKKMEESIQWKQNSFKPF
jgi:hypothetical protein